MIRLELVLTSSDAGGRAMERQSSHSDARADAIVSAHAVDPLKRLLPVVLTCLSLAQGAHALDCRGWARLGGVQRADAVDRMIDRVVSSHAAQQYNISKARVARCLERYARDIEYAFDDVCSDRRTADKQAINNTFNRYVWTCVR